MPLQATSGAASYDAFGGGVPVVPKYIEDYFSTFLYSGTGASQTITNGIDLATKGGLVWYKRRSGVSDHGLVDTARGMTSGSSPILASNLTDSQIAINNYVIANTTGFSFGSNATGVNANASGSTYVSWSWAKAPKFFDVQTWTGTGSPRTIAHNLGSVPGFIIVKRTDTTGNWICYHRSLNTTAGQMIVLNLSAYGALTEATSFNSTAPTSTVFTVGTGDETNGSGGTFVAYIFAHNAGGFGLTGTDNVISCGSYTGNGAAGGQLINLGYEAQWVMIKNASSAADWWMLDTMRGWVVNGDFGSDQALFANSSAAEQGQVVGQPDALGFRPIQDNVNQSGQTYIYIAIRRGPMKVPTSGTSVFAPLTYTGNGTSGRYISGAGFPPDLIIQTARSASENREFDDRLRGGGSTAMNALFSNSSNAEAANSGSVQLLNQDGFTVRSFGNGSSVTYIGECFRRAPSFFDEVCYTGTGSATTFSHNLGVAPELMIVKDRTYDWGSDSWAVYSSALGATKYLALSRNVGEQTSSSFWNDTAPTASVFTVGTIAYVNAGGDKYVAYLFATCAGVSKVGSYTGTGTTLQVDCGFTGGARFVLIKRTDSTGSWYVWDVARGISSGNDPYLLLNSTAAEVTNTDYIDAYSAGFEISSTAPAEINASGGSFIFLAIS